MAFPSVALIGSQELAGFDAERFFASRSPSREVSHPWALVQGRIGQAPQSPRNSIEECPKDFRARQMEVFPKLLFGYTLLGTDRRKRQHKCSVEKIRPRNNF